MRNRLTLKQNTFCLKFFESRNATQAAIAAGYSPKSARFSASRMLTNSNIQQRLNELQKVAEDATIANVQERKQILTEIARGRVGTLLDENQRIKQGEPLMDASIQEVNTFEIKAGKGESAELAQITKIKLHPPIQAITELNKMENVYGSDGSVDNDQRRKEARELTDEELIIIIRRRRSIRTV